jgi:phospholipid/cholesterol/gamma-HCH transport system permease protein
MEPIFRVLENIGFFVRGFLLSFGKYSLLVRDIFVAGIRPPFRAKLIFKQLEFVGNKSLNGKSLALELAPVMCGFIVTGRAGAAMAAEIATMRVNEQLDAMESMGVHPISYLMVPRVIAGMLMMPVLTGIFLGLGIVGCYIVGQTMFKVDNNVFIAQLKALVWVSDIRKGLFKSFVFGFILTSIACYRGYNAKGGAKGVGEATTNAVVTSLLAILISDFFITLVQMKV